MLKTLHLVRMGGLSMTTEKEREYRRVYDLRRYRRLRKRILSFLGNTCAVCGGIRDLQVDHRNPGLKRFNVSSAWGRPWTEMEKELRKCQLLCRSCHKKKTAKEQTGKHGTWGRYKNGKCRCDRCRKFVVSWIAEWRKRYRPTEMKHGTLHSYRFCSPRCDACKRVMRDYQKRRYSARKCGVVV